MQSFFLDFLSSVFFVPALIEVRVTRLERALEKLLLLAAIGAVKKLHFWVDDFDLTLLSAVRTPTQIVVLFVYDLFDGLQTLRQF